MKLLFSNTTADFFRHSRENGNPGCLWASNPQLDTRFRGYNALFYWYSAVLFQRVTVVLINRGKTMISIERPGQGNLEVDFILIDFEGTLASDRRVHPKAKDKINLLSKRTKIYILVKEKKECVEEGLKKVKAETIYLMEGESSQQKLDLLRQLGATRTVAIGNGIDDTPMIEEAGFGICMMSKEGTFSEVIKKADIVFMNILDALDFLLKPLRQKATLGK